MNTLRRVAVLAVAAVTAPLFADPAAADPAPVVWAGAHVDFRADDSNRNLIADLERVDGATLLDVEWFDRTCDAEAAPRTCTTVGRRAYDVVPTTADLSLDSASVTADFSYVEFGEVCDYIPVDDGEEGSCTETAPVSGTTHLELTWTATGEVEHGSYHDSEGRLHVSQRRWAQAWGTAFDDDFPVEESMITQLAQGVICPAP